MISTAKLKSGSSGACIGYMLGDKLKKDQRVRVVAYEGFALSRLKIAEIESIPSTAAEKTAHKKAVWQIANNLSKVFDARTALADYRVNNPLEDYVVSFVNEERERLRRPPTMEERKQYGLPKLKEGEADERPLERIILEEFLAKIGVHGEIEKRLRRKGKDGKKYTVKQNIQREAMFLAVAHDGTAHPHLHVLTARPDANGVVNDTRNERRRILSTINKLSKKYNLSMKLEGYEVDQEKTNEGYAAKIQARDNALWALETATDHEEFERILCEGMTGVIPSWKVHSETGKEYGILFTKIDRHGKEHTWSGSQLDRALSYGKVEAALARNLAARKEQEKAARAIEERRLAAEKIAREPETFVIHSGSDATLFSNRPYPLPNNIKLLHEAARTILAYRTWGAKINSNTPNEFVDNAVYGQRFGTVSFDIEKARFVGKDRSDGMLENPDEVIHFFSHDGQALDLFTPGFWTEWHRQLGNVREELARKEAYAAEVKRKENEERNDMIAGYNSIVPPIWDNLKALRSSSYQLYKEAKDAGLTLSAETDEKYRERTGAWNEYDELRRQANNTKVAKEIIKFLGGALACLNPIVGFTAAFLAAIVLDIKQTSIRSRQKQLLDRVDSVRRDLTTLKQKKAALNIVKQERLQQYLDAKNMYQEYQDGLKAIDSDVTAINSALQAAAREDYIRQYVSSEDAKNLIADINGQFVERHYSLVPGPLLKTEKGMRWILYTEGFRDPNSFNRILYHQQEPAPQDYGESYIDFSYNEKGELVGSVECDPKDNYKSGLSGQVNIKTGESSVARRTFCGSREEEKARKQKIKDTYDRFTDAEKKPKKNTGPKPGH